MKISNLRRLVTRIADFLRRRPARPPEDPYSYVGARRKPKPSSGSAKVAIEEP